MMDSGTSAFGDVLIVDSTGEAAEVIATVLQRRGFQTMETTGNEEGLHWLRSRRPSVAVVELKDDGQSDEWSLRFREASDLQGTGLILVGETVPGRGNRESVRSIGKPYRFEALIRTIEEMALRGVTDAHRSGSELET